MLMEYQCLVIRTRRPWICSGILCFLMFTSILLTACLCVEAHRVNQHISLKETNAPLEKVFMAIEKQSSYYFVYNSAQLKQAKPVTINVNYATLEQDLSLC